MDKDYESILLTIDNSMKKGEFDISKIKVTLDGANVTSYFEPEKSGKKITLTNTKYLSVADGLQKKKKSTIVSILIGVNSLASMPTS